MIQFKSNDLSVKDVDEKTGRVILYASAFGNIDSDGDIIQPGAFKKTLMERGPHSERPRIKHLFQHDTWNPIGVPVDMMEDQVGLRVESQVSDIKNGDYRKLYYDGVITEHSIGFKVIQGHKDESQGANMLTELKLWEYSAVTWGANEMTPVVDMKSLSKDQKAKKLLERMDRVQKALKDGSYMDETFHLLEIEMEIIKDQIKSLIQKEPEGGSTSSGTEPTPEDFDPDVIIKSLFY